MAEHRSFSADGFSANWVGVDDDRAEQLALNWDNEAWTATVRVEHERIDYVLRVSPLWHVRQFLLFRDMEQPDLWLGTDGVATTVGASAGISADDVVAGAAAAMVTGRFTRPEEVADLVVLLASDRTSNVTGAEFTIDGGMVTTL